MRIAGVMGSESLELGEVVSPESNGKRHNGREWEVSGVKREESR